MDLKTTLVTVWEEYVQPRMPLAIDSVIEQEDRRTTSVQVRWEVPPNCMHLEPDLWQQGPEHFVSRAFHIKDDGQDVQPC